ncbi:unnamed protein product [Rotaria sp. Silwood2]|nr:unnamed protein product [Rotaria sp. Silwood2]
MLTYRDGTVAQDNPSLKLYPDSFLIQLYTDGIRVTNTIGPKKDDHKLQLYYFVLEDLPDVVRSMLQSMGLVEICSTKYLSSQTNRIKYFEPIVKDLNYLQATGLTVMTFNGRLHFVFILLAADHLVSNDIGGFQRNFWFWAILSFMSRIISIFMSSPVKRTKEKFGKGYGCRAKRSEALSAKYK